RHSATTRARSWAPTMIFRMCPLSLRGCLRKDRQQKTARIADLERAAVPLGVVRVRREHDAGISGPLGDLVDLARLRRDGQAQTDSLLAVAPLLPIVLVKPDLGLARSQHYAE